jgi:glucose-1-phosphate thymidylyltransferase
MSDSSIDKVVILARGLGTRMRRSDTAAAVDHKQASVADTGVKALIPIDRPFLDYVLSVAAVAGYRRVCLVVGPQHDSIRDYYGRQVKAQRLSFDFAVQEQPRGTADAVLAAEAFAGDDPFVMLNSDNYYPLPALQGLRQIDGAGVALFDWQKMLDGGNIPADRLRQFSVGLVNGDGCLQKIVEKPDAATWDALPRPILMSMNCWRFEPWIFKSCRAIKPSQRGELELPDAVQHAINVEGRRFRVVPVSAPVLDLSTRQDIAPVTAKLAGVKVEL